MSSPTLKKGASGRYYVHWTEDRRSKRVSTGTTDLAEAKKFLGEWLLLGRKETRAAALTCADIWQAYRDDHVARKVATTERHDFIWGNLSQHFGNLTLAEIDQAAIDEYVDLREEGEIGRPSTPATCWLEFAKLKGSWNYAVRKGLIPSTALPRDIEWPAAPSARDRWLTSAEMQALFNALEEEDGRLSELARWLWVAVETGARRSAILDLRWDAIDPDLRFIDFRKGARPSRTKKRVAVPVTDALRPVLERARKERRGDTVCGKLTIATLRCRLAKLAALAGVEGVTPHVIRHSVATHMARQGVSLWDISGVLGNSVRVVEQTYAKHSLEGSKAALQKGWRS